MNLRIAMVGAGGVGGMCAGHMVRNGEDVTFIAVSYTHLRAHET